MFVYGVSSNSSNRKRAHSIFSFSRHTLTHSVFVAVAPILDYIASLAWLWTTISLRLLVHARWTCSSTLSRLGCARFCIPRVSFIRCWLFMCVGVLQCRSITIQIRSYSVCAQHKRRENNKCIYRNSYAFLPLLFSFFFFSSFVWHTGEFSLAASHTLHECVISASEETNEKREKEKLRSLDGRHYYMQ